MKKNLLSIIMVVSILSASALAGCSSGSSSKTSETAKTAETGNAAGAETAAKAEPAEHQYTSFYPDEFDINNIELPEGIDFTQGESITLNAATQAANGSVIESAMFEFEAILETATGGRIQIETHPNGTLGNMRELYEQTSQGILDFYCDGIETPAASIEQLNILCLPYAFTSPEHCYAFLDDEEAMAPFYAGFDGTGVKPLVLMLNGFHDVSCNGPMVNNSFNGQKIRVVDNQASIDCLNAMGAIATPVSWSEVYTALQQGTVDGCATMINNMNLSHFYEVQSYIYQTQHMAAFAVIGVSDATWNKLSDNDKILVEAAARAVVPLCREIVNNMSKEHGEYMMNETNRKIQVLDVEDKDALIESVRASVYPKYEDSEYADLLDSIINYAY